MHNYRRLFVTALFGLVLSHATTPAAAAGSMTTIAGTLGSSNSDHDGIGTAATFDFPTGIVLAGPNTIDVADHNASTIRKIALSGATATVSTFAGLAYQSGTADGVGTAARFGNPQGLALDAAGNLYVADLGSTRIRKIASNGAVTTLAGSSYGIADGSGSAAQFALPSGIAVDAAGNLYVVDQSNSNVRKVTPTGVVTTFAGTTTLNDPGSTDGTGTAARFNGPAGIAIDTAGNLYVADYNNQSLRKITPAAVVTTLATGLGGPAAVAVDAAGAAYVACYDDGTIAKVTAGGAVSTDQSGLNSSQGGPQGVALATDGSGNLYVADTGNSVIRKITSPIPAPASAMWQIALAGLVAIAFLWSVQRRRTRCKARA
jgi:sugar lactone lactonase YvrE